MSDYIDDAQPAPAVKPEGAPVLIPLLQLPRRQRAKVLRNLGNLLERQKSIPAEPAQADGETADEAAGLERAAAMFDLLADFEDLLKLVAAEPDAFDAWNENANDTDLSQLATYYMRTFQAGEVQASPAS